MSEQQDQVSKSSCSSISTSTQGSEDDGTVGALLTEAKTNGRSLGKRLSHLDSLPHTPRVNGKIPDFSNATIDHESLLERLGTYGLAEYQIEGDGNCQFRALADQIFRNPDYHRHVRKAVVKQSLEPYPTLAGGCRGTRGMDVGEIAAAGGWAPSLRDLRAAAERCG